MYTAEYINHVNSVHENYYDLLKLVELETGQYIPVNQYLFFQMRNACFVNVL